MAQRSDGMNRATPFWHQELLLRASRGSASATRQVEPWCSLLAAPVPQHLETRRGSEGGGKSPFKAHFSRYAELVETSPNLPRTPNGGPYIIHYPTSSWLVDLSACMSCCSPFPRDEPYSIMLSRGFRAPPQWPTTSSGIGRACRQRKSCKRSEPIRHRRMQSRSLLFYGSELARAGELEKDPQC